MSIFSGNPAVSLLRTAQPTTPLDFPDRDHESRKLVGNEALYTFLKLELKGFHELAGIDDPVFSKRHQTPGVERLWLPQDAKEPLYNRRSQIHHEIRNFHHATVAISSANQL